MRPIFIFPCKGGTTWEWPGQGKLPPCPAPEPYPDDDCIPESDVNASYDSGDKTEVSEDVEVV